MDEIMLFSHLQLSTVTERSAEPFKYFSPDVRHHRTLPGSLMIVKWMQWHFVDMQMVLWWQNMTSIILFLFVYHIYNGLTELFPDPKWCHHHGRPNTPNNVSVRFWLSLIGVCVSYCLSMTYVISRVSCQKGPTRHAYTWQIGPFWQDTLDMLVQLIYIRKRGPGHLQPEWCPIYSSVCFHQILLILAIALS